MSRAPAHEAMGRQRAEVPSQPSLACIDADRERRTVIMALEREVEIALRPAGVIATVESAAWLHSDTVVDVQGAR